LLFHPMKWQSEENVGLGEAAEWARHFAQLETDMDRLLADLFHCPSEMIEGWVRANRYVTGAELAKVGLAEMVELKPLDILKTKR
jgi:ATP-dependent Clp protease, protease subunit